VPQPQPSAKQASVPAKSTLADWTALEDDDYGYTREKRPRGGRKKRKKNHETQVYQNWDDLYDPSRPSSHEQYRESDQRFGQPREWKDYMYAHRSKRSPSRDSDSDDYDRSKMRTLGSFADRYGTMAKKTPLGQFAPPINFAPPPNLNDVPPTAVGPDDPTGEDAFARRAALGQRTNNESTTDHAHLSPPPPAEPHAPVPDDLAGQDEYMRRPQGAENQSSGQMIVPPPPNQPLDAFQPSSATISRAPVRYNLPPPPDDIPASQAELDAVLADELPADREENDDSAPRSLRPGQQGFAERLLSKYGWTKGSGLGATGSGMVKPLQVKVEKRKKRPDSEGGGFVTPAGRGKIIGSHKKGEYETSKFGPMGEVIILRGMLDGMDLDAEMEGSQNGGLMQEIGEECNEKVCFPLSMVTRSSC
jgi:splicing factor 45